jgi:uncharacterized membrane protein YedE/YeeE
MKNITSLLAGIFFGIGLVVSGMTNPAKVIGFLDITGDWDFSLALVMAGAVIFNLVSFTLIKKRSISILNGPISWPNKNQIDLKLLGGASLFGIGWGLVGICPGPAIVNLINLNTGVIIFVLSMLSGMFIYQFIANMRAS